MATEYAVLLPGDEQRWETAEQLTGFHLVRTDDLDDLLDLCGLLTGGETVEVRAVVPEPDLDAAPGVPA